MIAPLRPLRPTLLAGTLALAAALQVGTAQGAAPADETAHVVRPGETLGGIANRAGVSQDAIAKANGLKAPFVVRAGQTLAIPRPARARDAAARDQANALATVRTASRVIANDAPQPAGSPETETLHVVRPGETLGGIAARAKVARVLIAEANGLQPPYGVRIGQELKIPRTRRHVVLPGETGFAIAMQTGVPWDQIALANARQPSAPLEPGDELLIPTLVAPRPAGQGAGPAATPAAAHPAAPATVPPASPAARFLWPVSGPIRRGYATGAGYHDGLDIKAPAGTMVRAAAAGTVKFAGSETEQFGNLVVLDHGNGWFTAYGFLSRITVKPGAKVAAGERIGLVGETGLAKGTELHFEVRRDGKPVDPLDELPPAP